MHSLGNAIQSTKFILFLFLYLHIEHYMILFVRKLECIALDTDIYQPTHPYTR